MMKKKNQFRESSFLLMTLIFGLAIFSCNSEDNSLAPYAGSPNMSNISVETGTLKPKITWAGGYVSVVGVNTGTGAKLDASLIWLIKSTAEEIHYPVTYGVAPQGTQNLISQFGGVPIDSLVEDFTYTYWVLKGKLWDQISQYKGKVLAADKDLVAETFKVVGDTVKISTASFVASTKAIDLYTNIKDFQLFGKLGMISIKQATNNKGPIISWKITQSGVSDTLISAMGIVMGQRYSATNQIWEIWSEETTPSGKVFGKKNLIKSPLYAGANFSGTKVFQEYPQEGLVRNKDYYVWIANSSWDGKTHTRVAGGYAYAYFRTW